MFLNLECTKKFAVAINVSGIPDVNLENVDKGLVCAVSGQVCLGICR